MRSSKKSTIITFSILTIVLVGAILFNYVRTQMSKNAAKHYVPVVKKESTQVFQKLPEQSLRVVSYLTSIDGLSVYRWIKPNTTNCVINHLISRNFFDFG